MTTFTDEGGVGLLLFEGGVDVWEDEGGGGFVPGPSFEPVEVLPRVDWTWVLSGAPPLGVGVRELTQAYGRALTLRVDAAWSATFTLDGRSEEAAVIEELATDLMIYREGRLFFRGRISVEHDQGNASKHVVQFTATDYRGFLGEHRFVGPVGRVFTGVDQGLVAWTLIQESQALPGGNLGISNGLGALSGTPHTRTYDPGKPVGEAIDELMRISPGGGEWEISGDLMLNRWYPRRGTATNVVLDYGGIVTEFDRLLSGRDFANSVMATASQGLLPATAALPGLALDPRGLWERQEGFTSVVEQATVGVKAGWLLDQASVLRPEISVTLAAGRWDGPDVLWLGDTCELALRSGRLTDAGAGRHRIVEIVLVPGDHGTEKVHMGLVRD